MFYKQVHSTLALFYFANLNFRIDTNRKGNIYNPSPLWHKPVRGAKSIFNSTISGVKSGFVGLSNWIKQKQTENPSTSTQGTNKDEKPTTDE